MLDPALRSFEAAFAVGFQLIDEIEMGIALNRTNLFKFILCLRAYVDGMMREYVEEGPAVRLSDAIRCKASRYDFFFAKQTTTMSKVTNMIYKVNAVITELLYYSHIVYILCFIRIRSRSIKNLNCYSIQGYSA